MNRTFVTLLVVALAAGVAVLGTLYYQQRQSEHRIDINLGGTGVTIEKK